MTAALAGGGSLLVLVGVWTVGLVSPGPDFFLVANRGVTRGFSSALSAAAGVVLGIEVWICVSLVGLGAILARFPQARTALSVLGGAYLVYLGWQSLRAARVQVSQGVSQEQAPPSGIWRDFLSGLMTNLGNPKALIFFGTLLLRFIPEGSGFSTRFVVWSIMTTMALVWFGALALAVSRPSLQRWLSGRLRLVNLATGAIFVALGLVMMFGG